MNFLVKTVEWKYAEIHLKIKQLKKKAIYGKSVSFYRTNDKRFISIAILFILIWIIILNWKTVRWVNSGAVLPYCNLHYYERYVEISKLYCIRIPFSICFVS